MNSKRRTRGIFEIFISREVIIVAKIGNIINFRSCYMVTSVACWGTILWISQPSAQSGLWAGIALIGVPSFMRDPVE